MVDWNMENDAVSQFNTFSGKYESSLSMMQENEDEMERMKMKCRVISRSNETDDFLLSFLCFSGF